MLGEAIVQQSNGLFCPLQCASTFATGSKLDFLLPPVVEKFGCYVSQYIICLYDRNQSEPSNTCIIPFWQRNTLLFIKCLKLSYAFKSGFIVKL
jgi:hypothetical protein